MDLHFHGRDENSCDRVISNLSEDIHFDDNDKVSSPKSLLELDDNFGTDILPEDSAHGLERLDDDDQVVSHSLSVLENENSSSSASVMTTVNGSKEMPRVKERALIRANFSNLKNVNAAAKAYVKSIEMCMNQWIKDDEKGLRQRCCSKDCMMKMTKEERGFHLRDVEEIRKVGGEIFWMWVRTCYFNAMSPTEERNRLLFHSGKRVCRVLQYRLPSFPFTLCQTAFCVALGIDRNTLMRRTRPSKEFQGAWPGYHGLRGNKTKVNIKNSIPQMVLDQVVDFVLLYKENLEQQFHHHKWKKRDSLNSLYRKYQDFCMSQGQRMVGRSKFYEMLKSHKKLKDLQLLRTREIFIPPSAPDDMLVNDIHADTRRLIGPPNERAPEILSIHYGPDDLDDDHELGRKRDHIELFPDYDDMIAQQRLRTSL